MAAYKMDSRKSGVMIYFDPMRKEANKLDDARLGQLFRAILNYADPDCGTEPEFDDETLSHVWTFISSIVIRDDKSYRAKSSSRKYAIFCRYAKERGYQPIEREAWASLGEPTFTQWQEAQNPTDVYNRIQENTDVYNRIQENTDVYNRIQENTDVYNRIQADTDVSGCMPTSASASASTSPSPSPSVSTSPSPSPSVSTSASVSVSVSASDAGADAARPDGGTAADADADANVNTPGEAEKPASGEIPTLEAVKRYCRQKDLRYVDPVYYFNYHEANGWTMKDGRRIANWKAHIVNWDAGDRVRGRRGASAAGEKPNEVRKYAQELQRRRGQRN